VTFAPELNEHIPNSAVLPAATGEGAPKHPGECPRCGLGRSKPFKDQTERCRGKKGGGDISPAGRLQVTFKEHADWHLHDDKRKARLEAAKETQNLLPHVHEHSDDEAVCDALSLRAELNPALHVPVSDASGTTGLRSGSSETLSSLSPEELPLTAAAELIAHAAEIRHPGGSLPRGAGADEVYKVAEAAGLGAVDLAKLRVRLNALTPKLVNGVPVKNWVGRKPSPAELKLAEETGSKAGEKGALPPRSRRATSGRVSKSLTPKNH
jgi:hypothetical protein